MLTRGFSFILKSHPIGPKEIIFMGNGKSETILYIHPGKKWWHFSFKELWDYRELFYFFVWRDIKIRYKQTLIGMAWAVIQPLMTMILFTLFFGKLAKLPSDGLPYPIFYFSGLLPWMYFAGALQGATHSIVQHQNIITKVYFPRLILPLSGVLSGLIDFFLSFTILIIMMLLYGIVPGIRLLFFLPFLCLAILTAAAFGIWLSALNSLYRDIKYIMPFFIQFWMFLSPVVYPTSLVPQKYQWIYSLNPMVGVIEGFRWATGSQVRPPEMIVFISLGAVLCILFSGIMYFRKIESTLADLV